MPITLKKQTVAKTAYVVSNYSSAGFSKKPVAVFSDEEDAVWFATNILGFSIDEAAEVVCEAPFDLPLRLLCAEDGCYE